MAAAGPSGGDALLRELAERGRVDFALVRGVLEALDRASGDALVAALRDRFAKRFCVVIAEPRQGPAGPWTANELRALGLTPWAEQTEDDRVVHAYGYDIGTYKKTPDWLNARHWAHPELWDKFRW